MRSRLLVLGLCLVLLLPACGGSKSDPTPTAGAESTAPTESTASPAAEATTTTNTPAANAPTATAGTAADPTATTPFQPAELATGHPRLWVRAEDLPRLLEWASDSNPLWSQALLPRAEEARQAMDDGMLETDEGGIDWVEYPSESYAQLFAFMSLVHPDPAEREDYAQRARTILMGIMNEAVQGSAEGEPWRDPYFAIFNRSRWWGESFGLTVDWIYGYLTPEDKATIRTVFLRWIEENTNATVTGDYNHPTPIGVYNDPQLTSDQNILRWALNNYFTAHMRNIGLMALSFDEADDPGGELTGALQGATGAWLYMTDALMRGDSRGGMAPEGYEYSPAAVAYVIQFLLALRTAGQDDPARWGPQVVVQDQPFWNDLIPATLHSLSPRTTEFDDYTGPVYQPAWYGDGQNYVAPDLIDLMGPLGIYDTITGNAGRLDAARWIQLNVPPGGADELLYRAGGNEDRPEAILYFMLYDPNAAEPADPRPSLPTDWFAPGIGHILSRTDWGPDATWFDWSLGWQNIDHQHGDGLSFEFYRNGEWLTKERTGYGYTIAGSEYHNTLALQNEVVDPIDQYDWRYPLLENGGQWLYDSNDPPGGQILAVSITADFVYALGDATALYNAAYMAADQILHASRSIIWLKPDVIVTYDRATSQQDGYFKRYWLQLPQDVEIEGNRSTMTTANGQMLYITTLLPTDAEIGSEAALPLDGEPGYNDPIQFRLKVEAPGGPADVRFLHVLQGADSGTEALATQTITSTAGTPYEGALVGTTVVLFPVSLDGAADSITYQVPTDTSAHVITGLAPESGYSVSQSEANGMTEITITAGGDQMTDAGGVLVIGNLGG